jgi:hypothetical protein
MFELSFVLTPPWLDYEIMMIALPKLSVWLISSICSLTMSFYYSPISLVETNSQWIFIILNQSMVVFNSQPRMSLKGRDVQIDFLGTSGTRKYSSFCFSLILLLIWTSLRFILILGWLLNTNHTLVQNYKYLLRICSNQWNWRVAVRHYQIAYLWNQSLCFRRVFIMSLRIKGSTLLAEMVVQTFQTSLQQKPIL